MIQEGQLAVTGESKYTKYLSTAQRTKLAKENMWVGLLTGLTWHLHCWFGRKIPNQINK